MRFKLGVSMVFGLAGLFACAEPAAPIAAVGEVAQEVIMCNPGDVCGGTQVCAHNVCRVTCEDPGTISTCRGGTSCCLGYQEDDGSIVEPYCGPDCAPE